MEALPLKHNQVSLEGDIQLVLGRFLWTRLEVVYISAIYIPSDKIWLHFSSSVQDSRVGNVVSGWPVAS